MLSRHGLNSICRRIPPRHSRPIPPIPVAIRLYCLKRRHQPADILAALYGADVENDVLASRPRTGARVYSVVNYVNAFRFDAKSCVTCPGCELRDGDDLVRFRGGAPGLFREAAPKLWRRIIAREHEQIMKRGKRF